MKVNAISISISIGSMYKINKAPNNKKMVWKN
jgi:hypothetical protein